MGMYNSITAEGLRYVDGCHQDGLAAKAPGYGWAGATGNEDMTVKRSGYAEITKMDDIVFGKVPGYSREGVTGMCNGTTVKGLRYVEVTPQDGWLGQRGAGVWRVRGHGHGRGHGCEEVGVQGGHQNKRHGR